MNQQLWLIVGLGIYFLLFATAVFGLGAWMVKRRREKPPLEFKLLRGPGESLRRRMNRFNEDVVFQLLGAALAPVFAASATAGVLIWLTPHMRLTHGLLIVGAVALPVLFIAGRWSLKKFLRFRNDRLGYLGERAVGEALIPLTRAGHRVFHDVPAEVAGKQFNVDHVVVGPCGLFAIETKTRRKGRARFGFEVYKVAYDGSQLIWPWAEDDFGLQQAEVRARWLSEWLTKMTCLPLNAQPVLALPGWYIVLKGPGSVSVVNHKQLVTMIQRAPAGVLTEEQVDLISRQLDERCRDVED